MPDYVTYCKEGDNDRRLIQQQQACMLGWQASCIVGNRHTTWQFWYLLCVTTEFTCVSLSHGVLRIPVTT